MNPEITKNKITKYSDPKPAFLGLKRHAQKVSLILLGVLLLIAGLIFVGCQRAEKTGQDSKEIVVASWGGTYQAAQRKAFFEPFSEKAGIKIIETSFAGEYAKIKEMVASGKVTWDLTVVDHSTLLRGIKDGLFEQIDYSVIDTSGLYGFAVNPYGVGADVYSYVMAYRNDAFAGSKKPSTWQDFWNIETFPGRRAMQRSARGMLEFALLADGAEPSKLYPLDVDRGFKSLDKVKKHVSVWWTTGQQPPQLLNDREVVITTGWSGRIWNAIHHDSLPITLNWNQGLLIPEYWVIIKGAPHKDAALQFINFALQPENQAILSGIMGLGPTNQNTFKHLPPEIANDLPTSPENYKKQVLMNAEWWADNERFLSQRFEEWLVSSAK